MEIFNSKNLPVFTSLLVILIITTAFKGVSGGEILNCSTQTDSLKFCRGICNEDKAQLPYSSTFCDSTSGSCVCDCRDTLGASCAEVPFTPCDQECIRKNPNPDVYLYRGKMCSVAAPHRYTPDHQCACECSVREDYIETNDILDFSDQ